MLDLCKRFAVPVILVGIVTLLVGLAWDAVLHTLDPDLAAREGVFTLENPGHVLFGGGIGITVLGVIMLILGRAAEPGRSLVLPGLAVFGLVALSGASFSLAIASGSLGGGHTHETVHIHEDGTVHTHAEHQRFQQDNALASTTPGGGHDHPVAPAITFEQLRQATELVARVREVAPRWADYRVAEAEGYVMTTAGRLLHYVNRAYIANGRTLDPERPESLVYYRSANGEIVLVGFMFMTPPGVKGPDFAGPLGAWHLHDNLCYRGNVVVALTNSQGQCPPGTQFRGVTGEMIHVWLFDAPPGVFAEMNEMMPYLQGYADQLARSR